MRLSPARWSVTLVLVLALGVWPVWRWYVMRTFDGSDEPYGLLALVSLLVFLWRAGWGAPPTRVRWLAATGLLGIYVASFTLLSPLPRAMLVVTIFAILCFPKEKAIPCYALLCLSLPVVATAQFYLGYPLRLLAGGVSVAALRGAGFEVVQEGTLLHWRGETLMVDAPCSGIRMLWVGLYLTACLSAGSGLDNRRSLFAFALALPLVIGANALRAAGLFFKEARIIALPDWTHAAFGIAIFAAAAAVIMRLTAGKRGTPCTP